MNFGRIYQRLVRDVVLQNPIGAADAQLSMIYGDATTAPTQRLFDLAMAAIQNARGEDLREISNRMTTSPRWPDIWPGEHYKLLAGMVRAMPASRIVEIGTYQGLSALTLAKHLPAGGRITTFDVVPYKRVTGHVLTEADFASGKIVQKIADLTNPSVIEEYRELLEDADLIFVDAEKDGRMERVFLGHFERLKFKRRPIIVFDDIRVWNMLRIWRDVRRPKLDLTSFGHYSGTGVIDWDG
jgi:predicted O-methyltransferase YrrM